MTHRCTPSPTLDPREQGDRRARSDFTRALGTPRQRELRLQLDVQRALRVLLVPALAARAMQAPRFVCDGFDAAGVLHGHVEGVADLDVTVKVTT